MNYNDRSNVTVAFSSQLIADKESNVAQTKRLPKAHNTLEVPLDYYLQGRVGGGFIERSAASKKKLSREELVGVGAKRKKIEAEKKRIYRMTVSKKRPQGVHDNLGVGREYDRGPSKSDERHHAAALQVKDDGQNLKSLTRPSTSSVIGVALKREKTAEELDLERRRRADIDERIILRQRMSQMEARQQVRESERESAVTAVLAELAVKLIPFVIVVVVVPTFAVLGHREIPVQRPQQQDQAGSEEEEGPCH